MVTSALGFGEEASMVGPQRGPRRSRGESEDVWRQIGDLLVRGHAQTEARFDRLEADVGVLKTDVGVLKTTWPR
jgi:hypothetical protein